MGTLKNLKKFLIFLRRLFFQNQSKFKQFLITSGISITLAYALIKILKRFVVKKQIKTERIKNANPNFHKELQFLCKIMFPRLLCKQTGLLIMHTATLICRTFLSIYVAKLDGSLVKNIVQKDFTQFARNLTKWLLIALPATSCNSLIKYLENKLDYTLKSVLVKKAHAHYFANRMYYKISLCDDIQVDQNLTEDIEKLTGLFVHLYSQLTKPLLDISLNTYTLIVLAKSQDFNYMVPAVFGVTVMFMTGLLMKRISPKFGKLAGEEAKRKGYLRFLYSRVQQHSEEIAFYGGEYVERRLIDRSYGALVDQTERINRQKLWFVVVEQFLMKYVWSAAGLCMISIPILLQKDKMSTNGEMVVEDSNEMSLRTANFTTAKYLLINSADAIERIMTSYKEVIELSGFTHRVCEMFETFSRIQMKELRKSSDSTGIIQESTYLNTISIQNISVITPNGDLIVPSLSLDIKPGMNLLITGPNGCGKSSLFRIICGLWDLKNGSIKRPCANELFYVPQRPYLPIGTLRDQIIYPHSPTDMESKLVTDADLLEILDIVNLKPVVDREGGLNAVADWKDVLSGGEKQRIGLSRLFYHKPRFAFLDECTSAISVDVEGKIYLKAKNEYNITLLTIAHRATLWQYHNFILQFDGLGNWKLEELNSNLDMRLDLKKEKDSLEKLLMNTSSSKKRLQELCQILGESSIAI